MRLNSGSGVRALVGEIGELAGGVERLERRHDRRDVERLGDIDGEVGGLVEDDGVAILRDGPEVAAWRP